MATIPIIAVVICAACGQNAPGTGALPWLHGFAATAASDTPDAAAARRMADLAGAADPDPYGAIAVTGELGTVLASHRDGVMVVDRDGTKLAWTPGPPATGSADDVVALAIGSGPDDTPIIAVAMTSGGHRTNATTLTLYRVADRELHELWSGVVEERDGGVHTGGVTLARGALVYRSPLGTTTMWTYEAALGRYVERTRPAA